MFRYALCGLLLSAAAVSAADKKDAKDAGKAVYNEDRYYRIVSIPNPPDAAFEVGGIDFTPDGRLMACTRRGEVWSLFNSTDEDVTKIRYKLFARGLHETLGLRVVNNNEMLIGQRGELTRVRDTDGDGEADDFENVCSKWGISGDYHEYAFLGPKEKDGSYTLTLNRGFGGALPGTGRPLYRGWAVKVKPDGSMDPFAYGLRSPCGVGLDAEGELIYTDNQGSWMAVCPVFYLEKGQFYGETTALNSLKGSPLEGKVAITTEQQLKRPGAKPGEKVGWRYDGEKDADGKLRYPPHRPVACWIPYAKMCNSLGEPVTDTSGGKFGPFTGQIFIGDQTKSNIIRVALEKVNGEWQGACFFFRSGFSCGIIRLCWSPDKSKLFSGQTARGWGSLGGKPFGLQRLDWTGETPMEILKMSLTKTGFDLTFTKPLDEAAANQIKSYGMQSYTYYYWGTYGSPEVDRRPETIESIKVSADRLHVSLTVPNIIKGRVYELLLDGLKTPAGEPVLHPGAWYTVSHLVP